MVVVLGVWGTIGYKILNGVSPDLAEITQDNFDVSFNPKTNTEIDTFSIKNIERDPFLGRLSQNKKKEKSISRNKATDKVKENEAVITYNGLIKKQNNSERVFVININNNQYLLRKGQIADSVKLVRGNEKEITIRYRNKNKTIKRQ